MTGTPETREAVRLARKVRRHFVGVDPDIQGAALVDMVATHVAGHVIQGDPDKTRELRAAVLNVFIEAVLSLVPVVDAGVVQPELLRRRH